MDYKYEFRRVFPKKVTERDNIDHSFLLMLLRESVRRGDVAFSNVIVNGIMLNYTLPEYPKNTFRERFGGLLCAVPKDPNLQDHIILEIISRYKAGDITEYTIPNWMEKGLVPEIPAHVTGPKRNALFKRAFRFFTFKNKNRSFEIQKLRSTTGQSVNLCLSYKDDLEIDSDLRNQLCKVAIDLSSACLSYHIEIENKWYLFHNVRIVNSYLFHDGVDGKLRSVYDLSNLRPLDDENHCHLLNMNRKSIRK